MNPTANGFSKKYVKLQAIDCYSAGATPETLAKQLGVDTSKIVKLNFNENLFVDRTRQTALIKEVADEIDLRMYPEDEVPKLVAKLSRLHGCSRGLSCNRQRRRRTA